MGHKAGGILTIVAVILLSWGIPAQVRAQNPIVTENALTGNLQSEWDVTAVGDPTIQGFATDISVNKGQTITFKINTTATAYHIDIYRLGYYGGRGARKVATVNPSASLPQVQPSCVIDPASGAYDCGNWGTSASWAVPSNAVSGVYIARPVRTDTNGASHIYFVVRDDSSTSDVLVQTSDTTWQAYNLFGNGSLYGGTGPGQFGRCYKVSYNRPFSNRTAGIAENNGFFWDAEYPMIRWLEANGYNITYASGVDTDRRGSAPLQQHKIFLSSGHDEYWSDQQRTNVESARGAGVNLAFFSGNEIYWKTRWENSIAGPSTAYRTLVCYKETHANAKIDPTPIWTGTWRDPRFSPPSDGGRPENAVTGQFWVANAFQFDAMTVSSTEGKLRLWRNTGLDTLAPGQTAQFPTGVLGYEWDEVRDNGFLPPGLIRMSSTTIGIDGYIQDYGTAVAPQVATHNLTLYRHSSGALVFGTGTIRWSWGLDPVHDIASVSTDVRMKQATVNILADMGVQPGSLQSGLVAATQSTDTTPPTSVITVPPGGGIFYTCNPATIMGTATDAGGGKPAAVEFSLDGGATWHPAKGAANWAATWLPTSPGPVSFKTRATDDSGRIETPGPGITVMVVDNPLGCSIWPRNTAPAIYEATDVASQELGVRFRSDSDGWIKALRFYKSTGNTGQHVGHLWANDGTLLASVTFTNETAFGWQEAQLSTPVPISAGVPYVASYHFDSGHFAADTMYFPFHGFDRPPLHALADGEAGPNGVVHVGPSGFPTDTWQSSNYWVDVVYAATLNSDTTSPSVTTMSPANGATGVSPSSSISAQFSKAMAPWTLMSSNNSYADPNDLFSFNPPYDSAHRNMLRDFKMGHDLQFTITQVPNGTYDVYIWTFEDTNPLTATISVKGNVVGTYTSGQAGSWKRLGPYTATVNDGNIQVRVQCANDIAMVSGLEVWQAGGSAPATPPATSTLYRAINLGGPAMTIDGFNWEDNSMVTPNLTMNIINYGLGIPSGNLGGIPNFVFNPPVDTPEHAAMLRTYRWNHDVQFTLTDLPSGLFNVYVWTFEPNAPLDITLSLQQTVVLPDYNSGPPGHWDRLGPFPVTISDGNLQVRYECILPTEGSFLCGIEVWQSSMPVAPPAGTFYRAINVGGPAMVIDGHNWEGEGTSNYSFNSDPYPFGLKDAQGNYVAATVTYDANSRTAQLQPVSQLSNTATYTAILKGGSLGVTDLAGNGLAHDVTWTFTTGSGPLPQAATPTFSPPSGTYSTAQSVTISDTSAGTQIYYTTNGSTPTVASTLYTGPISVATTTTVKAIAAGSGWITSAVGSATYTIQSASAPAAPSGLSATAFSASQVDLSWSDNASNETSFLLERKVGSGGTYSQIATLSANTTIYSDTTVSDSTTYFYRIRANNANGNSAYSNEATVATPAPPPVPSPWTDRDIGSTGLTGSATYLNNTFTVKGSGADIWNTADAFHFVYQPWTGDGTIVAQVVSVGNSDPWAKAGVMIRDTINSNAKQAMVVITPGSGVSFQRRTSTGGSSTDTTISGRTAPQWLGLVRSGSTFTAYYSGDGINWTQIGSATISMSTTVQLGLAVTAHNNSALSTAVINNVSVGTTLGAPSNLTAVATSSSQINLLWADHSTSETGFKIERKTGSGGTYSQIATVGPNINNYSNTGLSAGTTYFYRVRANTSSSNSAYSNEASATTRSDPPSAPTNLGASAISSSQINIAWTDNSNNETGFKIERKTGSGGSYSQIATVGAGVTTYSNTGLAANTAYYYRVRSTNSSGDSSYSNEANATTSDVLPSAPGGLVATAASSSQINLSWTDNSSNETGFKIERKTGSGGSYSQIATTGAGVAIYNDIGLTGGTTYFYRVRATNAVGDSAYSAEASATTLTPPPAAPSGLAATAISSSQINLVWNDVANETGYKIERKTGSGGSYSQIATVGAGVVSYSSTGLEANTNYFYRVRATNAGGDSGYSNEANATTLNAAPAAPSALGATAVSSTQINLSWTDNASNETGFKIERKIGSGGTYTQIATANANATSYNDTGLSAATTYYYRVRATNSIGDSAYSNEANATTSTTIPAAPSNLAASAASSSQINLSWTDNATNETGFKLERKTGSGGTYSQIATVGAGIVTYSDTGLAASTTYYYRVRATNAAGDSAYSAEAFATTSAPPPSQGLQGDYFNNMDFSGYALSRLDATVDFNWASGSPDPSIDPDTFSVRWSGQVQPQYSQTYTFYTTSDDGVALYVNGQLIINNWTDHGPTENSATIALVANQRYDVVLLYYENGGGAVAQLSWSSSSQSKQIIPSNRLFPVPPAPLSLAAAAASTSRIDLTWSDISSNETGFKIERKTGSGGTYAQIATLGANVASYSDTGLAATTTYYYRLRATNSSGDSSYSTEASATTLSNTPAAPSNLSATAVSSSQINLSWTDNASNETGFKIERKTGSGGSYSQIATVGANVTTYSNTALSSGTTYYYRVRATNASGDSAYSNEASATSSIPSFRAASSKSAASGSLTITKPSGTQSGDVMVAEIAVRPNTATISGSGWTLVRRTDNANSNPNSLAVYYKVAGSSEPSSYTFTISASDGSVGGILTFANINTSSPVDAESGQNTSNSTSLPAPGVTTHFANDMIVTSHAFASAATFTPPSGMTEAIDIASTGVPSSAGESIEANYQVQASVGSTGTKTATASNDADVGNAHTLALKAN